MGSKPVGYSASRVSTLIGLNQYQTPLEIFQILKEESEPNWNKNHGYTMPTPPDGPALRWGTAFEDAIIKLAEEKEGCQIINRENLAVQFIDRGLSLSCHQDGQFSSGYHMHPVLHEGKTTNHWAYSSTKKEIQEAVDITTGQIEPGFKIIRRWGEPGTDEVPQEYQIQAAVQRICTGAELVKLSVLVFPKGQDEFEAMGWKTVHNDKIDKNIYMLINEETNSDADPEDWAYMWSQMGNFHTYKLPSNPPLEAAILKAIQKFHVNNFLPGIPPNSTDFDDVRRLLPNPIGSVLATEELTTLCQEYSANTKSLGSTSPLQKRQDALKVIISNMVNKLQRSDAINPPDKMIIINPSGGDTLATFSKSEKTGTVKFSAARAK